ncbi:isopentenyl-diphosphate Delta-isomerase [Bradyrhizobium lablabi]|uniref:isopentenyl-diphosphate Delta-isomerase n=1 Tax=Bradyrhizobium lablabi TaxID=722472 RepID=UPI001BACD81B|nr:isopentenyl-diphosphate Delta-isomerase [Bradyrhizobium lablabi]MBR0692006.1 isopentenyl-diphosphate Delta-isomerase [Bradyrhizobium lablabi]
MTDVNSATAVRSFGDFLAEQWGLLCRINRFADNEIDSLNAELRELLHPWGNNPIGHYCQYPSFVSDDGFPAEFSLSWRASGPEVRILFESLSSDLSARGAQDAGRLLTRRLASRAGVDINRYLAVEELFTTDAPLLGRPTIWHSMAKQPGRSSPRYKVYLNPQSQGLHRTLPVVSEAMARIGMSTAWRSVAERYAELEAGGHKIEFFALDLEKPEIARAKVYFRHHSIALNELDTVASLARGHDSGRASHAYNACYDKESLIVNEPMTCLAFRTGSNCPEEANVYLRLNGAGRPDPIMAVLRAERADTASYLALKTLYKPNTSVTRELLSFRTISPASPADVGLYLRFPQYDRGQERIEAPVKEEMVVLCTPAGATAGILPKSKVHHRETPLHLAFSCYLFDQEGNLLVTRRSHNKRTWPGVITNSCCGHPAPDEPLTVAVRRRVKQELGLSATDIKLILPAFRYKAQMANGVAENELCPVFTALANPADLTADPEEVDSAEWLPWSTFAAQVLRADREVSPWCRLQIAQLASLGPDPMSWPVTTGRLPAAALL